MTWIVVAGVLLWVAVWLVAATVKGLEQFLNELGRAAEATSAALTRLLGRAIAVGVPQASCEPSVLNTFLPRPDKDSVVTRLREYADRKLTWPDWTHRWQTDGESTWNDAKIFVEDVVALTRGAYDCSPPYDLLNEPDQFPSVPIAPKKPNLLAASYPQPILKLPDSRIPLAFFRYCIRCAYAHVIGEHEGHLKRHRELEESAIKLNDARNEQFNVATKVFHRQCGEYEAARRRYLERREAFLAPMRAAQSSAEQGDDRTVALQHFDLVLRRLDFPSFVPRQWMLDYDAHTRTLLIEHRFPAVADAEILQTVPQVRAASSKPVSRQARQQTIATLQAALALILARAAASCDRFDLVDAIAINGWVEYDDKATGHRTRAYCCNVIGTKQQFNELSLSTADPSTALARLKGATASEQYEIAPLRPNLRLSADDPRFVPARETLGVLSEHENLAAMPWEDFEHLVRELFERKFGTEGAEVRITRASRDHGVDAIIFDNDPIRGGKIVVQAKRYTIPVDVSAVRDLYGTVLNEGANSGMLVTTSTFGPDAYLFAQNKPLKLFNGAQLLGLLEEAGYRFRIDIAEARRALRATK